MIEMIIGYARTSTIEQIAGFEAQLRELKESGCEKIFHEQISSISKQRSQLDYMLDFIREGDVLIITKIDRLARSVAHLLSIIDLLEKKQVGLKIINLGIDTHTPTGRLVLTILAGIAQFEREIMLERQREGIAKAKAIGKFKGRKPMANSVKKEVLRLVDEGKTKSSVARHLGIGEASVYRILKENNQSKLCA